MARYYCHLNIEKQRIEVQDNKGNVIAERSLPVFDSRWKTREVIFTIDENLTAWKEVYELTYRKED